MLKKVLVNILIVIFFITGAYFVTMPLVGRIYFDRSVKLEADKKLAEAIAECKKAMRLDPLEARYRAQLGGLYIKDARANKNSGSWEMAREAYGKAKELNPLSAKYRLGWAEAEAILILTSKDMSGERFARYKDELKKAIELDPNGYFTNAYYGYYMLRFRGRLSQKELNYVIYRLRHALELNPRYANEIYATLAHKLDSFDLLQKITPDKPEWQARLVKFMRKIDYWKYRGR
ncbi:MAG: hypothetical protein JW919_02565 [Candidatus Omnitrophica bacterium]|nr:hypothetical protein [Candidatus Omnitrophota bacterium]